MHEIELSTDAELYRNFILTTPAYTWLIKSLQREVTITRADPDMMEIIGNKIFGALPSYRKVSRKVSSPEYKATFEVDWDPLAFVKEQQYTVSPEIAASLLTVDPITVRCAWDWIGERIEHHLLL